MVCFGAVFPGCHPYTAYDIEKLKILEADAVTDIIIIIAALALVALFIVSAVRKSKGKGCGCNCGTCGGCGNHKKKTKANKKRL